MGVWWGYDITQALFNRNVVKVFGLGVPGLGPQGIAAGVLVKDVADKKHLTFFIYALCLFFGGIFGLDSFIVGDTKYGIIRLVSLLVIILAPVAIIWWLVNIGILIFNPKNVTDKHWQYFGAPPPGDHGMSFGEKMSTRFPFLEVLFSPIQFIKDKIIGDLLSPFQAIIQPVTSTIDTALLTGKSFANAAKATIETAGKSVNLAKEGVKEFREGMGDIAKTAGIFTKIPQIPESMTSQQIRDAASNPMVGTLVGGGDTPSSNVLPFALLGTIAVIAVSGFVATYRRSKKNEQQPRDDAPPEPGVPRKSDKKEPTETA
jgi:TM2 domain-containing membrane protein YozV